MKKHYLIPAFIGLILLACTPKENTETQKKWYKGNLHTHSFWSDGDDFPEMIMDWYKTHDYDFIGLSDHNIFADHEKWKVLKEKRKFIYDKYLEKYGDDWVESRNDSTGQLEVRLKTLAEYRPLFEEEEEFLIIPSEEVSDRFEDKPIHINITNIQKLIKPQGGNSVSDVMQRNINKIQEQRDSTGVPMFPHINHPNFYWAISPDDMIQLTGERFFEVYNGHPLVYNYGDSLHPSMEELWDLVQTAYMQEGKPSIFGLAVDDAHSYHSFGPKDSNPGRGWVMVNATALTPESIIEAMENGDFYATTGVVMEAIEFDGQQLSVKVKPEDKVSYTIQFFGSVNSSDGIATGILLEEVQGTEASYTLKENDLYVRAKVISSVMKENPFNEGDKEVAWTQPVSAN